MIFQRAPQALMQTDLDEMCLVITDSTTLIAPSRPAITLLSVVVSVIDYECSSNEPCFAVILQRATHAFSQREVSFSLPFPM